MPGPSRPTDFQALANLLRSSNPESMQTLDGRRHLVAMLCKIIGYIRAGGGGPLSRAPRLPPRTLQVLELLLLGKSEKEAATALKLSRHTVHVHVKVIYRASNVTSRAELLAKLLGSTPTTGP